MRSLFLLLFMMAINLPCFTQGKAENPVTILKSPDGIMYINNTENAYFCIDFKGDSIVDAGFSNGFKIDRDIFQVNLNPFDSDEYNNSQDSEQEVALLKAKMKWELDYVSDEVYKKKLAFGHQLFKNKDGKNYFLWHYVAPAAERKEPTDVLVVQQAFLTFVANQYVVGISTPIFEGENIEERKKKLRELADRIDVMGSTVDVDGLYYKMDSRAAGKDLQYVDSANGYVLNIPEWFNITKSPREDIYIGTLPDIDNVQNAIMVQKFKKSGDGSLKDFNEKFFPSGQKLGDKFGGGKLMLKKELPKPANVNGLSMKITHSLGSALYYSHYLTIETASSYLVVVFTATERTFDRNHPRFLEFVESMEVIK